VVVVLVKLPLLRLVVLVAVVMALLELQQAVQVTHQVHHQAKVILVGLAQIHQRIMVQVAVEVQEQ
jgi:hypothetical protein